MRVFISCLAAAALLGATLFIQGCTMTEGWQFSVGIHPVNGVQDTKTLNTSKGNYASDWRPKKDER